MSRSKITITGLGYPPYTLTEEIETAIKRSTHIINTGEIATNDLTRLFGEKEIVSIKQAHQFGEDRADTYRRMTDQIQNHAGDFVEAILPVVGNPSVLEGVASILLADQTFDVSVTGGRSIIEYTLDKLPLLRFSGFSVVDSSNGLSAIKCHEDRPCIILQAGRGGVKLNTMGYPPRKEWWRRLFGRLQQLYPGDASVYFFNLGSVPELAAAKLDDHLEQFLPHLTQQVTLVVVPRSPLGFESSADLLSGIISPIEYMLKDDA